MSISGIGGGSSASLGKEFAIQVDQSSQFDDKAISSSNSNETSFADSLKNSINKVNDMQKEANSSIESLVTGDSTSIHETLVAVEKADIALKLMTQVRNKIIDAYNEIMKMQV